MFVTVGNEATQKLQVRILLDAHQSMPRRMQDVNDADGGHTKYLLMTLYKKINFMYDSIKKINLYEFVVFFFFADGII
jgi:hypothetical protein